MIFTASRIWNYICDVIIKFYRSNQPVIVFSVPVAALVAWLVYFVGDYSSFEYSGVAAVEDLSGVYFGYWPWLSQLLALGLVVFQALFFNRIISEHEIFDRITFVPSFVFIVFSAALSVNGMLTGTLVAITFLLFSLDKVLSVYREVSSKDDVFLAALWIGMAGLFYVHAALFLLFVWIGVSILKRSNWREWVLAIGGIVLPLFFLISFRFAWNGSVDLHLPEFSKTEGNILPFSWKDEVQKITLLMLSGVFLLAFFSFFSNMYGTIMKTRRQRQVLLFFLFFSLIAIVAALLSGDDFCLMILIIPFSVMVSFWLTHSKSTWLTDTIFYLLMICLLTSVAINGKIIELSFLFL